MYISIGQAAEVIGVAISTLRCWEDEGKYIADYRTFGGHRRYCLNRIHTELLKKSSSNIGTNLRKTITYARVSSFDQKLDLKRQENRLEKYCIDNALDYACAV